ncbi:MAG: hypothetical protein ABJC19_02300 [Gemmatimonadota bacterium]
MALPSPYRQLSAPRRVGLVAHDLSSSRPSRDAYIAKIVARGGGFRAEKLRQWPADQLAREIVRHGLESLQDELGLLQTLYVELEPGLQIAFLEAAGVPHDGAMIPEDLAVPFAEPARVRQAAEQLLADFGEDARHYLRTIALYNTEAWPGLTAFLDEHAEA